MKSRLVFISIFLSSLLVSLGIFFGLWFVSGGLSDRGKKGITVTGSAQISEVADTAVWYIYVNTQLPSIAESVKKVEADTKAITDYLRYEPLLFFALAISTQPCHKVLPLHQSTDCYLWKL